MTWKIAPKAAAKARRRPPEGEESTRERPSIDS